MGSPRWLNRARVAVSGFALAEGVGFPGPADALEWRVGGDAGVFIGYRFGGGHESGFGFGLETHGVLVDQTNDCGGIQQLYTGAVARLEYSGWKTARLTLGPVFGTSNGIVGYAAEAGLGAVLGRGSGLLAQVGVEATGGMLFDARVSYAIARDWQIAGGLRYPPISFSGLCVVGRPLRRDGRQAPLAGAVLAALADDVNDVDGAGRTASVRAARVWTDRARLEWASVPAFCELAEQLVVSGAPRALVDRARQAAADELRHAEISANAAGSLAGSGYVSLDPPASERRDPQTGNAGLLRLVVESYVDGCVAEGAAAAVAAAEADVAEGRALRRAQHTIAIDEARHAELAWAILEWAASADPSGVRAALRGVCATVASAVDSAVASAVASAVDDRGAPVNDIIAGSTERFGILGASRSTAVRDSHGRQARARLHARLGI